MNLAEPDALYSLVKRAIQRTAASSTGGWRVSSLNTGTFTPSAKVTTPGRSRAADRTAAMSRPGDGAVQAGTDDRVRRRTDLGEAAHQRPAPRRRSISGRLIG
jgi:hypothetical protein